MLSDLLLGTGLAAIVTAAVRGRQWQPGLADLCFGTGNLAIAAGNALIRNWLWVALPGTIAIWCFIDWWRDRRKRKRALRAMGAKGLAAIAAMVRTVRERSRPRPVLRPAPGGAR